MTYLWHLCILALVYGLLALSLNLITGFAGRLSLCHAAFFGLGAYGSALLAVRLKWPFLPALIAAALLTGLVGLLVGMPALRLREDSFVLATLGFQVILSSILANFVGLTGGPYGIPGIPIPRVAGFGFGTPSRFLCLAILVSGLGALSIAAMKLSPFGRVLRALRDDEVATAALGKNVPRARVVAFTVAAVWAGVAGSLFASYVRYIDPTSFSFAESIFVLSAVVIGGAGSVWGPALGALFLVLLPELLNSLSLPAPVASQVRQVLYGVLLVALMRWRPRGLFGEYDFR